MDTQKELKARYCISIATSDKGLIQQANTIRQMLGVTQEEIYRRGVESYAKENGIKSE